MFCADWIKEHQTLIAGLIGFAGVVITLFVNGWLQRRQDEGERQKSRHLLRSLLIEELRMNKDSLRYNHDSLAKLEKQYQETLLLIPTDTMDDGYTSLIGNIGSLSDIEIQRVMYAYSSLKLYYKRLHMLGSPVDQAPGHVQIPSRWAQFLIGVIDNLLGPIDEAIEAMEAAKKRTS